MFNYAKWFWSPSKVPTKSQARISSFNLRNTTDPPYSSIMSPSFRLSGDPSEPSHPGSSTPEFDKLSSTQSMTSSHQKDVDHLSANEASTDICAPSSLIAHPSLPQVKIYPRSCSPHEFSKLRILGQGDVGRVYLVLHSSTGKLYAMKVLCKKVGDWIPPTLS